MTQVKDLTHLIALCEEEKNEFFVMLNGGLRSSKSIQYDGGGFDVINEIDWSNEFIQTETISETLIGGAISKGALYCYE